MRDLTFDQKDELLVLIENAQEDDSLLALLDADFEPIPLIVGTELEPVMHEYAELVERLTNLDEKINAILDGYSSDVFGDAEEEAPESGLRLVP